MYCMQYMYIVYTIVTEPVFIAVSVYRELSPDAELIGDPTSSSHTNKQHDWLILPRSPQRMGFTQHEPNVDEQLEMQQGSKLRVVHLSLTSKNNPGQVSFAGYLSTGQLSNCRRISLGHFFTADVHVY
jgi:hypothetical protein